MAGQPETVTPTSTKVKVGCVVQRPKGVARQLAPTLTEVQQGGVVQRPNGGARQPEIVAPTSMEEREGDLADQPASAEDTRLGWRE